MRSPLYKSNSLDSPSIVLTAVLQSWYVSMTILTNLSDTPFRRRHQYNISLGTRSYAFSRSTKPQNTAKFPSILFSTNCLTMNIASTVLFPGIKPNCLGSIFTTFRTRLSNILSKIFSPCSNNLISRWFPHPRVSPFFLKNGHYQTFPPILWDLFFIPYCF